MSDLPRRDFIGLLGASALLPRVPPPPERATPQIVLFNGNIITVNDRQPRAQAAAIAGGRFLVVGTNDEVRRLATARTVKVNLEGKTVVPGFVDAHSHPAVAGRLHLRQVDCDLRSISAIQQAVRERAAKTPAGQ